MGAFLLYKKNNESLNNEVCNFFSERGFEQPREFVLDDWILRLYPKILVRNKNYYFVNGSALFVTGTIIYKGNDYNDSLKYLLEDNLSGKLKIDELYGTFTLIFYINNKISILRDKSNISNVYYNVHKTILSSSFLATSLLHNGALSIDKKCVLENLVTGFIIGPNTVFNEIKRIEKTSLPQIDGINFLKTVAKYPTESIKNTSTAINMQIDCLVEFFQATKSLADHFGVDIGLTGGFDSRLLLILALKYYRTVSIHTFWRNQYNREVECVKKISEKVRKELKMVKATHPLEMSEKQLINTIRDAFFYYDGHIRMHHNWHEEYNTLAYRKKVVNNHRVGLFGIGGEQYRNGERIVFNKNFYRWIKYEIIYRTSRNCFINKREEKTFIENYLHKINDILKVKSHKIDHFSIKRFYNEIQIPGHRSVRTNVENSDMFFLNPFADYNISIKAYRAIPFLGLSSSFQQKMISQLNQEIASVKSNYGYDFYHGEPVYKKFYTLIKELIPSFLIFNLYIKRKKSHNDQSYREYERKFPIINELEQKVHNLNLPLELKILKKNSDLYPLVWATGYLLKEFHNKIKE